MLVLRSFIWHALQTPREVLSRNRLHWLCAMQLALTQYLPNTIAWLRGQVELVCIFCVAISLVTSWVQVQYAGVKVDVYSAFLKQNRTWSVSFLLLCRKPSFGFCKGLAPPNALMFETQFYLSVAQHISVIVYASLLPEGYLFPVKAKAWLFCCSFLQA